MGVVVRDVLRGYTDFVADVGFSTSARPGLVLASRMISHDSFLMSTGAAIPVPPEAMKPIIAGIKRMGLDGDLSLLSPVEEAELAAMVIRMCLESGAADHVRFAEPGEHSSRVKQSRHERSQPAVAAQAPLAQPPVDQGDRNAAAMSVNDEVRPQLQLDQDDRRFVSR